MLKVCLVVLVTLACVQAVSIERRTLRTQDTLDAGRGGGKCDFNECDKCLDADCVWVKTGATYEQGKCNKKGFVYNGGLTKYKYGREDGEDIFQETLYTCQCAVELAGTSFSSKCKNKKFVHNMYEYRYRVANQLGRLQRFNIIKRDQVKRKYNALMMEADIVVKKDPKPISPKGEANPVHAAQLADGEKVLIKSFPGGDWKERSLFTLLATHNNIAKYKGHIKDAQSKQVSVVIESCGVLLSKFLEKSAADQKADADLSTRLVWLVDIGEALQHLHMQFKTVFGDLSPGNIFVGCSNTCGSKTPGTGALANTKAKLVDLSSSAHITSKGKTRDPKLKSYWKRNQKLKPSCSTRKTSNSAWFKALEAIKASDYSAPEAAATADGKKKTYGPSADIFSMGKLIDILANKGKKPSQEIQNLVDICTNKNPQERPCITHVLSELKEIHQDSLGSN